MPGPSNSQLTRFHAFRLRLERHKPSSRFTAFLWEFGLFVFKQAWSCLFGGLLLALVLGTRLFWPHHAWLARYDFLFLAALLIQVLLLAFRMETLREAKVILMFHVIGTLMELFKTHVGSWTYPEANLFRLGHVPLFSGFMYASVGSYLARVWRALDFRFSHYPDRRLTYGLALLIYANFFTHHYLPDLRWLLFAAVACLYGRTWVYYKPYRAYRRMPLLLGFALVALFIWIAENAGTFGNIWVYPDQHSAWHIVHFTKFGAWFLLMIISFILVSLAHIPQAEGGVSTGAA
ncbi:DUF817 domain-containing protein [Granulicella tundricola]|uniref:DUF817 domain-containing protein n=1 Tax=Granulicella tundricola (strain ATCC BAA-1859 / DSM 23138 / MP5ACTX9) TaxID=1198114 RepID=E8X3A6_GRATM|nr:DUF817 domain-containing protein [Granulicella tundricola]ADW70407.1 protein of unknown function DUF817 [Granulicella tundricola MP5ACTX9]